MAIFLNSDILENVGSDSGKCGCTNMAIREFLAERLADYEIPRKFALLKEFPKTESGKIRKKELWKMLFLVEKRKWFIVQNDKSDVDKIGKEWYIYIQQSNYLM